MRLFLVLLALATAYTYGLLHTTSLVLGQVQQLNRTYQNVAEYADHV